MSLQIIGTGCVTPLALDPATLWDRLAAGDRPEPAQFPQIGPVTHGRTPYYLPVPATPSPLDATLSRSPRIRRSSAITVYSVAAGITALRSAGLEVSATGALAPEVAARTAVLFAVCSGGVNYTRRFFEKIVAEGPAGASPLLFPETVYNAPASHLAAVLGTDGITYTLVGDSCVGLSALDFAEELLLTHPEVDQCLVVGAEECDPILWQGYATWRLTSNTPCVQLHAPRPAGLLLSEGAAAVVVRRSDDGSQGVKLEHMATTACARRSEATTTLSALFREFPGDAPGLIIGSANGTWIDAAEAAALRETTPDSPAYYPKGAIGDSLGASALTQVVLGVECLQRGAAPGQPPIDLCRVAISTLGLNQQAGAALVTL